MCPACWDELEARYKALAESLPRLGDGGPATLGATVFRCYRGDLWEARVESVQPGTIDVIYTTDAKHRAKGCRGRFHPAAEWFSTADAARKGDRRTGGVE